MKLLTAITTLQIALDAALSNEPIYRKAGNDEQADICLRKAEEFNTAIELLQNSGQKLIDITFGEAIEALKNGGKAARAGWNGKGMWIAISCSGSREVLAENFWSPHARKHAEDNSGKATVLPSIIMKTANGEILMGWLASQSDMLANDWYIVG